MYARESELPNESYVAAVIGEPTISQAIDFPGKKNGHCFRCITALGADWCVSTGCGGAREAPEANRGHGVGLVIQDCDRVPSVTEH